MESRRTRPGGSGPGQRIVLRVVLYHALLAAALFALWRFVPADLSPETRSSLDLLLGGSGGSAAAAQAAPGDVARRVSMLTMAIAMLGATLISFPVAWLYTLARQKKGYRQSLVQALVLMPAVVAGVVVIVKYSVPLAFALAGIVAAVRFRNTLDDSKDAIYIFLATAIGIASGVDLTAAFVLSVGFNLVTLLLWYTDFGRSPAPLEGMDAQRRLERVLAMANRTGEFVAQMDREVLAAMAPEQLEALAERAVRRRRRNAGTEPGRPSRPGSVLRVRTVDPIGSRAVVEPLLESHTRRWRYQGTRRDADGGEVLQYAVRFRPDCGAETLLATLRSRAGTRVLSAEFR